MSVDCYVRVYMFENKQPFGAYIMRANCLRVLSQALSRARVRETSAQVLCRKFRSIWGRATTANTEAPYYLHFIGLNSLCIGC